MLKVFIGVHDRDRDIDPQNTYYVEKIIRVKLVSPPPYNVSFFIVLSIYYDFIIY
jgi:hypothetical protein